ncbi:MAG: hypothetical protein R3323_09820, partial [Wenzhouxiangellaceae bacterium]|nr:hypothetical protein [Wenzhouxiangellaceae bacterium]
GCIAAMPRLRRETGPAGLRLPGGWTIPLIAFSASLLLLIQVDRDAVAATALVLVAGLLPWWMRPARRR